MKNASLLFAFAIAVIAAPPAAAVPGLGTDLVPNFVGVGLGSTTQYAGGKQRTFGVLPGLRYQFEGSERFIEWYGTLADWNVIDSKEWQFGPALNLRLGRKNVDDEVVSKLPEIDNTIEGGLFVSYTFRKMEGIPFRLRVGAVALADLGHTFNGMDGSVWASAWMPLSPTVFLGLGGGASWSSASFNQTFFGVTPEGSAASGLPVYTPGSGMRQWYAWPAVVWRASPQWYLATGGLYQRLVGDAADSPIVTQRGDRNQWTYGFGVGWSWK